MNYIERLLTLASAVTGCVSILALASLIGIPIEITSSSVGSKNCAITPGIIKCNWMNKKKKKKHYKRVLLAKTKLNTIESLNSRNLIDSHIIHDEFVLVNNVLSI